MFYRSLYLGVDLDTWIWITVAVPLLFMKACKRLLLEQEFSSDAIESTFKV